MFLEVRNLTKSFGGVMALNDVSFSIEEGELVGMIGPNGSGKTTIFNLLTGVFHPAKGQIIFQGSDITRLKPYRIARKGIVRTYQSTTIFRGLTVLENAMLGQIMNHNPGVWHALFGKREDEKRSIYKAEGILELVGLIDNRNKMAKSLTQEEQKRLSIAVALGCNPKLLLLNEPTGGVNMDEIRKLIDLVQRINSLGITICVIEHKLKMIMGLSQRIIVLSFGTKIAEGTPDEIYQHKRVIEAYLGEKDVAQNR